MFCCVDVLVEVAPSTFTVHFAISLIQYMLESIVLSMCSFAASVQQTKCYYKLQVVGSENVVFRCIAGQQDGYVSESTKQWIRLQNKKNVTLQQPRFWSPISSRLLQTCCCEMSFSPNHFSCCTNVAALFSFFDFSRNLLTTVFGSEILRQRRECCLLAFPSSKEFTHYITFVVCVLFGWSNVDVMCSAVGSCRSLREILRFLLIARLQYTSLCSKISTDLWKSNIWIPK